MDRNTVRNYGSYRVSMGLPGLSIESFPIYSNRMDHVTVITWTGGIISGNPIHAAKNHGLWIVACPYFGHYALFDDKRQKVLDGVDLKSLTYFHSIRIPVEIVLALLFHQGIVSVYMTFEGTNFVLFSGITVPLVAFLAFRKTSIKRKLLLWWNVLGLLLLLNVVITAVFAIPSPFQKLSLDQPNMAVLYFPFNLLSTVLVPLELFAHLVAF